MYMGHLGVALAGKGLRPSVPLAVLATAALASDLLDAVAGLAGVGGPLAYAWTHSVPGGMGIALVAGLVYGALARDVVGAGLVGAAAVSHVLSDLLTSRLLAWPGGPEIGLHLYRYDAVDFVLETGIVVVGWGLYRTSLTLRQRSSWPVWAILVAVVAFQLVFQALPIS